MEYNTSRPKLLIPEYGRNMQKMVEYACGIKDRVDRNDAAYALVDIMASVTKAQTSSEEVRQQLWDQLYILSDFKLDVDGEFPPPSKDIIEKKPEKLAYPNRRMKYKHYGRSIEKLIKAAVELKDGEEKDELVGIIANLMKKDYLQFNRDTVKNEMLRDQLVEISGGKLKLPDDFQFEKTSDILKQVGKTNTSRSSNKKKKRHHKRKHKR